MAGLLRNLMPLSSRIPYVLWRVIPARESLTISLYTGETITLRRPPNFDLEVAFEVFVSKLYLSPRPLSSIKFVVDVGTNVGYSLVFLAREFPEAKIMAFEPHSANARQAMININANHLQDRVDLHVAAAGIRRGTAYITDRSARSHVVSENHTRGLLPIEIVDFFDTVGNAQIDLLKIDCEGGEYDLVMDSRFENLKARVLVMEWHLTPQHPQADTELILRLNNCGWDLVPVTEYRGNDPENGFCGNGVVWGFRR
jgi:FkbM family methyltransferase